MAYLLPHLSTGYAVDQVKRIIGVGRIHVFLRSIYLGLRLVTRENTHTQQTCSGFEVSKENHGVLFF